MLGRPTRFLETAALGLWQTNCYVVGDLELGTCVVVDPGQGGAEQVGRWLDTRGVRCEAILLTHGHLDHLWAVPELAERLDVPVLLHAADRWLWDDPASAFGFPPGVLETELGLRWKPPSERLEPLADHMRLRFAGLPLLVRHTPGHTPGSCVFLLTDTGDDDPLLLSGDLVFAGSVGRTDLPGGSWDEQMASLRQVVLPLEDRTAILPGHGPSTTVGAERAANPYLRQLA